MKDQIKKIIDRLKTFVEAWKIWVFIAALFGTNTMTAGLIYSSEPEKAEKPATIKPIERVKPINTTTIKEVTIYKVDKKLVKKLIKQELQKHFDSSRH